MLQRLFLSLTLTAWSTMAMAQTAPGGAPPAPTTEGGVHWLWIGIALVVLAVLVWQFLARRPGPADTTPVTRTDTSDSLHKGP
jgi:bacteriorhodopsin